jgi:predicted transglutaminase-like cysteine proteinase
MKILSFALALALAGAPAVLAAQTGQPQQGQQGWHQHGERQGQRGERRGRNPLAMLIAHRQQLNLTDAQVSQLQAIRQRLEAQNRPLMERVRSLRQQAGLPDFRRERREQGQGQAEGQEQGRRERPQLTPEQRQAMQRLRPQLQPIMQQLRANNQAAMKEVQSVLTDAQKQQIRQFMRQRGHGRERGERQGRQQAAGA